MIGRIVIDLDVESQQITQLQRTGFLVHKRGSKLRVEIGGSLIAQDKAVVRFEDVQHEQTETTPGESSRPS